MYSEVFKLHAKLLKAMAHPRRLEIINLLRLQEMPVGDIHSMLDLPQANISQHLMILREARIVSTRRAGKQIYYSVSHKNFIRSSDLLREVLVERCQNSKLADVFVLKMKDLVPLVHDPVCGMRISPQTASFSLIHASNPYYFCASGCLKEFKKNHEKYVH